jgi:hypothetical protein
MAPELPSDVVDEAERLTRLAHAAVDEAEREAYRERRGSLLAEHGFAARLREDEDGRTLICYPDEWFVDGKIRRERIDDIDRAVEVSLSGAGEEEDWEAVETHNRALAERVEREHGPVHGATAHAFADFMGNHYIRRIETAGAAVRREFREEYFVRNAWPSDDQLEALETSLELLFTAAHEEA